MATKRTPGSRPGLIHCNNCGEDYSETYRRCPFCDEYEEYDREYEDEDDRPARRSGGKRLAQSNRRGGGYTDFVLPSPVRVIAVVLSLAVILAAVWIMASLVKPLIDRGDVDTIDPNVSPSSSISSNTGSSNTGSTAATPNTGGSSATSPSPSPSIAPNQANGLTLNQKDFSFNDRYPDPITITVTFTPAGTSSDVTWTSSDPDVATVDENGKVSHGTKKGNATITATLPNGVSATCAVYNQVTGSGSASSDPEPSPSSSSSSTTYTINKSDFTFYTSGEKTTLKVSGYTGTITWSSSNTSVATVDSSGVCTAVGNGTCTITGTLDNGATVTAIARVKI